MTSLDGYEYNFHGVPVWFPYDAYDVQKRYMESVIRALQEGCNALLESPTGTGKTLCLLCAALAWQQHRKKAASKASVLEIKNAMVKSEGGVSKILSNQQSQDSRPHKILYCSRTHSQIQQVASELLKTKYKSASCTLFGSRAQLCLHPTVKGLSGTAQVAACDATVKSGGCTYTKDIHARKDQLSNIADIEDLVHVGQARHVCPYYATKELADEADIVFMPYNYVTEDVTNVQKLLQGSILILDEAHNMESVCQDTASFDLSSGHVAKCMQELSSCIETLTRNISAGHLPDNTELDGLKPNQAVNTWKITKKLLGRLEGVIKEHSDPSQHPEGFTKPASHALEVFNGLNITEDSCDLFISALRSAQTYSASASTAALSSLQLAGIVALQRAVCTVFGRSIRGPPSGAAQQGLRTASVVLDEREKATHQLEMYKVHYHMQTLERSVATLPCMSFWCMSAGVVMQRLHSAGVRNILLTSGTLSPLDATAEEIAVPMSVRLENPHVVPQNQVHCSVLCKGPKGATLNGSYNNRSSTQYQRDLGAAVRSVAAATPHGMLVFFPSHAAMKAITDEWRNCGLWKELDGVKPVLMEPRTGPEFSKVIEAFRSKVASSRRGALLLAVCQGRISEGIDFSDEEGRAVVVAGIPFPPAKDPRVLCKKQTLDERRRLGQGRLTGSSWYTLCAMRVVNQALGRVIRHKADFGAILLADERFARADMRANISFWARQLLTVRGDFAGLGDELATFFQTNEARAPPRLKRRGPDTGGVATFAKAELGDGAPRKRPTFMPPKRSAAVPGGDRSGAGRAPRKAGAAENGSSALAEMEQYMSIPCAKDVVGLGHIDRETAVAVKAEQAAAPRAGAHTARLAQQRLARAALASADHTCCAAAGGSCGGGSGNGSGSAVATAAPAKASTKGGATTEAAVKILADLKEELGESRYRKIKVAINGYIKGPNANDAEQFARSLGQELYSCTGSSCTGQEVGAALEQYVRRQDRVTFRSVLQDILQAPEAPTRVAREPSTTKSDARQPLGNVKSESDALKPRVKTETVPGTCEPSATQPSQQDCVTQHPAVPVKHELSSGAAMIAALQKGPNNKVSSGSAGMTTSRQGLRQPVLGQPQHNANAPGAFAPLRPGPQACVPSERPPRGAAGGATACVNPNRVQVKGEGFFSTARSSAGAAGAGLGRGRGSGGAAVGRGRGAAGQSMTAHGQQQSAVQQGRGGPGRSGAAAGAGRGTANSQRAAAAYGARAAGSPAGMASAGMASAPANGGPSQVQQASVAAGTGRSAGQHGRVGALGEAGRDEVAGADVGGGCRACGVALEGAQKGSAASCGHLVCGPCWVKSKMEAPGKPAQCPVCNAPLRDRNRGSGGASGR